MEKYLNLKTKLLFTMYKSFFSSYFDKLKNHLKYNLLHENWLKINLKKIILCDVPIVLMLNINIFHGKNRWFNSI